MVKLTGRGNATSAKPAPAPSSKKKEVAVTSNSQSNELAVAEKLAARFAKAAGQGATENMGAKDFAIPFIRILDKSSGQTIESSESYVDGARPGSIFNTVTKELFDGKEGIQGIFCGYKPVILEWESAEPGSGFIAEHPASSTIKQDSGAELKETAGGAKRLIIPENGHMLQDANLYYFLHLKEDGDADQTIISMTGSNLTVSRLLNSALANRKMVVNGERMKAPSYGIIYTMRSKAATDGQFHWHTWDFEDAGLVDDDKLFDLAESFYETVTEGKVKGNYSADKDPAGGDGNADLNEDEIPFK